MQRLIFALSLIAFTCDAVKIEISRPTTTQSSVTNQTNGTTTEGPTSTTQAPTTVPTTAVTKVQPTKPSTTKPTSTITETPTTITTPTTPAAAGEDDSKVPAVTSKIESVLQLRCKDRPCNQDFCACNLNHGVCDIDCCCDSDCTDEELKTVNCVGKQGGFDDSYYQMTLTPCNIDSGYLCVFRSNFDGNLVKNLKFDLDNPTGNEWPMVLLERNEPPDEQSFYKINDPVLLYNLEANEIVEFDVPFSLTGQHCQTEESIRHLRSKKTSCYVRLEKAQSMEAKLYQKLCTSLLLQRPNIRVPMNGFIKETQLEYLSINLFRCTSESECVTASIFNSTFDVVDDLEYSSQIHVKIYHNITDLLACEVFFMRAEQSSESVWQHFEVSFIRGNRTDHMPYNVSGPLGYNQGEPVIVGHKVMLNESAEWSPSNSVFSFFHPNRTEPIHIHPPRRRLNSCERSQDTVNFGESILVQCSVQLDNSTELNSETNFTRVCWELQNRSLEVLAASDVLHLQEEYFISILGYPVNEMKHWIRIVVKNYEHLPVVGVYLDKEYAFMCQNMILGLKYEFMMLTETVDGNSDQAVVKRATIDVGKRHDLQFQLDESISIPLTFSVIFRDPREASGSAKWSPSRGISLLLVNLFGFVLLY